jgi:hypothetical protein
LCVPDSRCLPPSSAFHRSQSSHPHSLHSLLVSMMSSSFIAAFCFASSCRHAPQRRPQPQQPKAFVGMSVRLNLIATDCSPFARLSRRRQHSSSTITDDESLRERTSEPNDERKHKNPLTLKPILPHTPASLRIQSQHDAQRNDTAFTDETMKSRP